VRTIAAERIRPMPAVITEVCHEWSIKPDNR